MHTHIWWTSARSPCRAGCHTSRESLEVELPRHGIAYVWMKELGGRRKKIRRFAKHWSAQRFVPQLRRLHAYPEFAQGVKRLVEIVQKTADPRFSVAKDGPPALGITSEKGDATKTAICAPSACTLNATAGW